ncbi:MAG: arginine decarboxylase, partial [Bacteroidetes bacterium]|nr:arginine decarboxylase [Bacteroidota bacterium]
ISSQIQKARELFTKAIDNHRYKGGYNYCYCTKSSHFSFVLDEALSNHIDLETSSAFDLDIIRKLYKAKKIDKTRKIICNGYKTDSYIKGMVELLKLGFENLVCVLDNVDELDLLDSMCELPIKIGLRVATEEEPNFSVYTSRLGMSSKRIMKLYNQKIKDNPKFDLKMMHFFVNSGIKDTSFYWSELTRLVNVYCDLKEECDSLEWFDIGGGMPIYTSLGVEHNYEYMIDQIIYSIKYICNERNVHEPHIFTEFGSFTVGESGFVLYEIIGQKQQNDKELWYMIDSSFITTLPDTWGIGQKFILLAVNHWNKEFQRINLGGLTCDGQDFYNSDSHSNQVFLPKITGDDKQYMGFFHTGAYQESLGGYGGIQHCLIPAPKHLIISKDKKGNYTHRIFAEEQTSESMLKILGY